MNFDNIPKELQALPQWVCWQLVEREGKKTKLPIDPKTGKLASTSDPSTWTDFQSARKAAANFSGIGFVFTKSDPYCGIDMDGHIDDELISFVGSYTELSQSGTGAHIICRAKLPGPGRRSGKLEIYDSGRFFVVTGEVIRMQHEITEAQDEIDAFLAHVFGDNAPEPAKTVPAPSSESDGEILDLIRNSPQAAKFDALWAGDFSAYGSASEADAALLSILRFWTGGDKARSIAMFGQSGLVRDKWKRQDYRNRTWASIDRGDVRKDVASAVLSQMDAEARAIPRAIIERNLSPWRKITTSDVQKAISGTMLEDMIDILRTPTNPPLPFEIGFAKALPIFGAFLCGEKPRPESGFAQHNLSYGIDRARVVIDTAGGQACNAWTILVAPSASGKDIGGLADDLLKRHGLFLGTAGSEEGIADALAENGNGVMMISEMSNWLDKRHWQSKAASFLTYAWSKGHFSHTMSKRGKDNAPPRETSYCYPSIMASIQPHLLRTRANREDMESGFLGRFVMVEFSDMAWFPFATDIYRSASLAKLDAMAKILKAAHGRIKPHKQRYQEELVKIFQDYEAGIRPVFNRLCNEYLLRIALYLLIDGKDDRIPEVFPAEAIERAGVVCQWLYGHAERLCGNLTESHDENLREAKLDAIVAIINAKGGSCVRLSDISMARSMRGTSQKQRNEWVNELIDRGIVTVSIEKKKTGPAAKVLSLASNS